MAFRKIVSGIWDTFFMIVDIEQSEHKTPNQVSLVNRCTNKKTIKSILYTSPRSFSRPKLGLYLGI